MPYVIVLDTGPLSNAVVALAKQDTIPTMSQRCRQWILEQEERGAILLVPAICYYETLRELERRRASGQIRRLQDFVFGSEDRFIPLTTTHLESAARLWATSRNAGVPAASHDALDADIILCAQALALGLSPSSYLVVTTNVGHLSRFVPCDEWANIQA